MTDRELLDLAAKAAELRLGWGEMDSLGRIGPYVWNEDGKTSRWWNPLTDDGDALRLAVKLKLDIGFLNGDVLVLNVAEGGGDPYAATRRAIVRAAAAIGSTLPATESSQS